MTVHKLDNLLGFLNDIHCVCFGYCEATTSKCTLNRSHSLSDVWSGPCYSTAHAFPIISMLSCFQFVQQCSYQGTISIPLYWHKNHNQTNKLFCHIHKTVLWWWILKQNCLPPLIGSKLLILSNSLFVRVETLSSLHAEFTLSYKLVDTLSGLEERVARETLIPAYREQRALKS